jgi:hypothetical protein
MAGMTDEFGLTPKQRKFAENVATGMSLADSYRNSYDAENMKPASVQRRACELMTDSRVTACVEAIAEANRRLSQVNTINDRDMLVTLLRKWSSGSRSLLPIPNYAPRSCWVKHVGCTVRSLRITGNVQLR